MAKKRILLITHNFSPEPIGVGKYNGEMIHWLANNGYDCTVITTFPYYPFWKVQPPYTNKWYKKEVVKYNDTTLKIYRCPSYIPQTPTGKHRSAQDFSYWASKFFVVVKQMLFNKKFDLIVTVAPPFHLAYLGIMFRRVRGGKLLYHIQDLQIEAARDLNLFSNRTILKVLFKIERNILHSADYVSSISGGMIKRIKTKVDRDITFFPNWVDTSLFYPLPDKDLLKSKWGYKPDDLVCLYSGAIGVKQGFEDLLNAAEKLLPHKHIKFVISSSGPYVDNIIKEAGERKISNISFLPLQNKDGFNEFLNMADIHLVMQKATASDLVMPSKLATILAVGGVSIITSLKETSLSKMVNDNDFGYVIEPGNSDLLVKQILAMELDDTLPAKKENARNYAVQHLNIDILMNNFVQRFLQ